MNELKKYELTDETKEVKRLFNCFVLHRIRALKDFGDVHAGDLGGWVESEENLSHSGDAWVYTEAEVYGNAKIFENAKIGGHAKVTKATDILTISPIGSRDDTTTFYKSKNNKIFVKCGCKNTDIDTWLEMVEETHGNNKHGQAYKLAAQIARLQIELTEKSE